MGSVVDRLIRDGKLNGSELFYVQESDVTMRATVERIAKVESFRGYPYGTENSLAGFLPPPGVRPHLKVKLVSSVGIGRCGQGEILVARYSKPIYTLSVTGASMTTIRLTDEDRAYVSRLCELTGLESFAAAFRLAIREAVRSRDPGFAPGKAPSKRAR